MVSGVSLRWQAQELVPHSSGPCVVEKVQEEGVLMVTSFIAHPGTRFHGSIVQ